MNAHDAERVPCSVCGRPLRLDALANLCESCIEAGHQPLNLFSNVAPLDERRAFVANPEDLIA